MIAKILQSTQFLNVEYDKLQPSSSSELEIPGSCSLSRRTECAEPCGTEGRGWDVAQASPPGVRVSVCKVVFQPFSSPVLSFIHVVLVITLSDYTGKGEGRTTV